MSKYSYTFAINDGEYHCRNNFTMQVAEIKKVDEKILKEIDKINRELDNEDDEDILQKLKEKKLKYLNKLHYKSWRLVDTSILFGNFLTTIMKQKREHNVKYVILCWDKSPYYHKTAIENYKADRYKASDRIKEIEEELEDENLSELDKSILSIEKDLAEYDNKNFWKYQEVKKSFLENKDWERAGFYSIYHRGYEADQIAACFSRILSKQYKKDGKTKTILLSADKDWINFKRDGVDFISTWTNPFGYNFDPTYKKLDDEWEAFHKTYKQFARYQKLIEDWKDITRYDYGILTELILSSHNNATLYDDIYDNYRDILIENYIELLKSKGGKNRNVLKPIAKNMANAELFFRIKNNCKDKDFKAYKTLKSAYKAMNIGLGSTVDIGNDTNGNPLCSNVGTKYLDDLEPLCMSVLKNCNKYIRNTIINLCEDYEISINMKNYSLYTDSLKADI